MTDVTIPSELVAEVVSRLRFVEDAILADRVAAYLPKPDRARELLVASNRVQGLSGIILAHTFEDARAELDRKPVMTPEIATAFAVLDGEIEPRTKADSALATLAAHWEPTT